MRLVFFPLIIVMLIAGETFASGPGLGEMAESPVPCIDTTNNLAIWIQLAGDDNIPPQRVYGRFTSWTPQTSTIGFKSTLSQKIEQIPIKSIHIEPNKPNPAAQVAMPTLVPLGGISRSYPASELSVADGVLKFPECRLMHGGDRLVFEGNLSVHGGEIHIQGKVFKVTPPRGGGGNSTGPKGG